MAGTVDAGGMLTVEVWRGAATGAFQTFAVPRRLDQTILDVVTEIQRDQAPTASYRFVCRWGVTARRGGPCHPRVPQAAGADGTLLLEPLRNFTVVKDLAVEMTAFFD